MTVHTPDATGTLGASGLRLPVGILGSGLHVPSRVVTNAELVRELDTSERWIRDKFGIHERRFLEDGKTTSDMCVDAAMQALEAAGVLPAEVDAIVLATVTPDQVAPSTAIVVAERIGAHRAIPIDLNQAVCTAGVVATFLASHLLQNDAIRHVLVIGGDTMSRITNPQERVTRVIFGDAASAVVMGRVPAGYGLLSWDIGIKQSNAVGIRAGGASWPLTPENVAAGDHLVYMDGKAVWETATENLPQSIRSAVSQAGVALDDIRYFAFHQANRNIIQNVLNQLEVPVERAGLTIDVLGNTCSASIFTVLHTAFAEQKVGPGDLLLVSGIGAGFHWGSLCFRVS